MKKILLLLLASHLLFADKGYELVKENTLFNGEKIREYKLPNGLQVLHLPRHEAKLITYQTWFRVGSIHEKLSEKLNKTGLAHLFEHMMFRGSANYPDGEFDKLTSKMGAEKQNATTSYNRTNYFQSIPSHQLSKLMELESDRMKNLKLTSEIFEKEKGAVVGELRRYLDSPPRYAYEELLKLAFEKATYRYTVIGTEEEIKGFKLEEAQYFYKTFYAPNNATLIFVGDATEEKLLPLIVKYYGDMKPQEIPKIEVPEEPAQKAERRVVKTHSQATSEILLISYPSCDVSSDDIIALSLMGSHLSNGMEARLRKRLVDSHIAVSAMAGANNKPNIFEFYVLLTENTPSDKALKVIDQEINRLQTQLISAKELERAKNQDLLDLYTAINDNSSVANQIGEYLTLSQNYLRGFEIVEGYKKVTAKNISKVAQKYLKSKNRSIVVIQPEKKVKK